jgi:hypothetical protein
MLPLLAVAPWQPRPGVPHCPYRGDWRRIRQLRYDLAIRRTSEVPNADAVNLPLL